MITFFGGMIAELYMVSPTGELATELFLLVGGVVIFALVVHGGVELWYTFRGRK